MDKNSKRRKNGQFKKKHGLTEHKWYPIWRSMMSRCYNENAKSYAGYGGRGIVVCDKWRLSPKNFLEWLESQNYSKGLQIDRIDNDSDYSPENCRIVDRSTNCRNRRDNRRYNVGGEMLLTVEVEEKYGIKAATFRARVEVYGQTPDEAIINRRKLPVKGYEVNGQMMSLDEIASTFGVSKSTFGSRVARGWSPTDAATKPCRRYKTCRS